MAESKHQQADIGLIGLAVMGENLALNMLEHGYKVAVFNRTTEKVKKFVEGRGKGKEVIGCMSVEELCQNLSSPRKILLLVQAGKPVDEVIQNLLPHLDEGDIVIDAGNSHYNDSQRRFEELSEKKICFVGCGISGGEEGALEGASIMPGGNTDAWPHIKDILQSVSARAPDGTPCCDWIGTGGSGHFIKMVHNGIEYGDMQLISEGYTLLRDVLKMSNDEISDTFKQYNEGDMDSFLVKITSEIFKKKDKDGNYLVDVILDTAGQKGTGQWTATSGLDLGVPVTLIGEAVFARYLSAQKKERVKAAQILKGPQSPPQMVVSKDKFVEDLKDALYASKIISYAQGFVLLREAAKSPHWELHYGDIAAMWRGGCIIQSRFLNNIKEAFDRDANIKNLLLDSFFSDKIQKAQAGWRRIASIAIQHGIPIPAITTALSYYDGYRTENGSANLIQAQRDYFGAHTFRRKDKGEDEVFHFNWTGRGGNTTAGDYVVSHSNI